MKDEELLAKYASSALVGLISNEFTFKKIVGTSRGPETTLAELAAQEAFIFADAMLNEHRKRHNEE